jgi:hypothetical protein
VGEAVQQHGAAAARLPVLGPWGWLFRLTRTAPSPSDRGRAADHDAPADSRPSRRAHGAVVAEPPKVYYIQFPERLSGRSSR